MHPKGLLQTSDDKRAKHPFVKEESSKPTCPPPSVCVCLSKRGMFLWGLRDSALAEHTRAHTHTHTHTHTHSGTQPNRTQRDPTLCLQCVGTQPGLRLKGLSPWLKEKHRASGQEWLCTGAQMWVVAKGQPAAVPCPHPLPLPDLVCPAQQHRHKPRS